MVDSNIVFCRSLLKSFRQDIRPYLKHLPKDCFKGAFTYKSSVKCWECRLPTVGYYWFGQASCAAEAKYNAFEAYVKKALPADICKEYSNNEREQL